MSTSGGGVPHWRADGRELFYMANDQSIMAVDTKLGETVDIGPPRQLFRALVTGISTRAPWAPTPDGQRFLLLAVTEEQASAPATVAINWPAIVGPAQ